MRKRIKTSILITLITAIMLDLCCIPVFAKGSAPNGIRHNGLGGIYIDINAAPFTTFSGYSMGHNAYDTAGCAWYASARVNQLTGKGSTIFSGQSWYNTRYADYGFSRGQTPQSGSLICWSGHVAVLEKIEGDTAYVSQGGYPASHSENAVYGYCSIDTFNVSSLPNIASGFLGYVYLGIGGNQSSGRSPVDIGDDIYGVILNKALWKPIEVCDDNYVRLATETGSANQLWKFDRQSDGSYAIISTHNGQVLDVETAGDSDGLAVHTYEDVNGNNQRWFIYAQGDGYILMPKNSNTRVLDLSSGGTNDGTKVQIWESNSTAAQIFSIYSADDVQLKPAALSVNVNESTSTATFDWSEVYGEDRYDVKIWKGTYWDGDPYYTEWGAKHNYSITLPAGYYEAYVDAANYFECKMSNVVSFTIPEKAAKPTPLPTLKPTQRPTSTPKPTAKPKRPEIVVTSAGGSLQITADGARVKFPDAKPFIDSNDRTQIPVRAVTESLGASVSWNGSSKVVTINGNGKNISLTIGSNIMKVNGSNVKMDTAAVLINDRTYVPIRYVAEAMDMTVVWK